jgi:hypothetical protein
MSLQKLSLPSLTLCLSQPSTGTTNLFLVPQGGAPASKAARAPHPPSGWPSCCHLLFSLRRGCPCIHCRRRHFTCLMVGHRDRHLLILFPIGCLIISSCWGHLARQLDSFRVPWCLVPQPLVPVTIQPARFSPWKLGLKNIWSLWQMYPKVD